MKVVAKACRAERRTGAKTRAASNKANALCNIWKSAWARLQSFLAWVGWGKSKWVRRVRVGAVRYR